MTRRPPQNACALTDSPTKPVDTGRLGDTVARDYARKLRQFNAFAAPELRRAIDSLRLRPGMRVLDAGCGTGEALGWFDAAVGAEGTVIGFDLAAAHVAAARRTAPKGALVLQADAMATPLATRSFDLAWSVNTIHHLRDPLAGIGVLAALLRPGGRIALGQSSLLPDMYFAWDARLERVTNEAVRQYYRDRYRVDERELTAVRAITGLLRAAELRDVTVHTYMIERVSPLKAADEDYLVQTIFRDTWGERLRPYLAAGDYAELECLCDPNHPDFALRRPDFHFLQTFTLAVGTV
jgi:SAM-dependent methyltransferase